MTQAVVDEVMLREPRLLVPQLQPVGPVKIDFSNPLTNGLVLAKLLGNNVGTLTVTGTRPHVFAGSHMRGFNTTYGVASTDKVAATFPDKLVRTYAFTAVFVNYGGSGLGRLMDRASTLIIYFQSPNIQVARNYSSQSKQDQFINPLLSTKATRLLVLDDSSGAGSAFRTRLFADGVEVARAGGIDSLGTPSLSSDNNVYIGNRAAGDRDYNGLIGDFVVWDRLLTAAEISAYFTDPYQFLIPA
jgi:hypothetical protein